MASVEQFADSLQPLEPEAALAEVIPLRPDRGLSEPLDSAQLIARLNKQRDTDEITTEMYAAGIHDLVQTVKARRSRQGVAYRLAMRSCATLDWDDPR
jgi:hypothetical protein